MKDDRHLALAKCPSANKCDKSPIQRLGQIQNKLTMNIRRHVTKFCQGEVTCEDPACTGRTRQLPLNLKGAYPVCSTCQAAIMAKEYSDKQLYNQLLYYQQLFDVSKASAKCGRNFNLDLAAIKDGQVNYMKLKQHVDKTMALNKYSVIDMSRLFFGFQTMDAATFRRKHRNM